MGHPSARPARRSGPTGGRARQGSARVLPGNAFGYNSWSRLCLSLYPKSRFCPCFAPRDVFKGEHLLFVGGVPGAREACHGHSTSFSRGAAGSRTSGSCAMVVENFNATSGGAASCRAKWMGCGRGKGETGTRLSGMENAQCAIHSGGFCFETTRTTRDNFFKVCRPTGRRLGARAARPRVAEEWRGWKPHLRKLRDGCSEGTATVPLSPPGRTRGSASLPRGSARGRGNEATE